MHKTDSEHKKPLICCPQCQSRLSLGLEETVMHRRIINPKTGQLLKRKVSYRIPNEDTRAFLFCENALCDFIADNEDTAIYGESLHLFDLVNEQDINEFSSSVKSPGDTH